VKKPRHRVFRVCAVCGKRHGVTYGFGTTLRRYGIPGDKATVECIKELTAKPPAATVRKPAPT
jgi:hypothetical protein